MTTIRGAILFFGLLGLIKFIFFGIDHNAEEKEKKNFKEMLKKHNMTQEEFKQRLKEG